MDIEKEIPEGSEILITWTHRENTVLKAGARVKYLRSNPDHTVDIAIGGMKMSIHSDDFTFEPVSHGFGRKKELTNMTIDEKWDHFISLKNEYNRTQANLTFRPAYHEAINMRMYADLGSMIREQEMNLRSLHHVVNQQRANDIFFESAEGRQVKGMLDQRIPETHRELESLRERSVEYINELLHESVGEEWSVKFLSDLILELSGTGESTSD